MVFNCRCVLGLTDFPGIPAARVRARILELDTLWQAAQERWPEVDRLITNLIFTKHHRICSHIRELHKEEIINLEPIGNFVMGYGPLSNLLAVYREENISC